MNSVRWRAIARVRRRAYFYDKSVEIFLIKIIFANTLHAVCVFRCTGKRRDSRRDS